MLFTDLFNPLTAESDDGDPLASLIRQNVCEYLTYNDMKYLSKVNRSANTFARRKLFKCYGACTLAGSTLFYKDGLSDNPYFGEGGTICTHPIGNESSEMVVTVPNNIRWLFSIGIRRPDNYEGINAQGLRGVADDVFVRVSAGYWTTEIYTYAYDKIKPGLEHKLLHHAPFKAKHGKRSVDKTLPKELNFVIAHITNQEEEKSHITVKCKEINYSTDFKGELSGPYAWYFDFGPNPRKVLRSLNYHVSLLY